MQAVSALPHFCIRHGIFHNHSSLDAKTSSLHLPFLMSNGL